MLEANFKKKIATANGPTNLDINLSLAMGEFASLFGVSGSGKTTILRILAGLTHPDEGFIAVNGRVWFDSQKKVNLPTQERSVGFVFQEYNLFPNMTLRENLQFALGADCNEGLIDDFLRLTALTEMKDVYPSKLSGGQKQRGALIRALIRKPQLLLLDEPFSALDLSMRLGLQNELLKIHAQVRVPTLMVSHDLADVTRLSKRVFLLENGKMAEGDLKQYISA